MGRKSRKFEAYRRKGGMVARMYKQPSNSLNQCWVKCSKIAHILPSNVPSSGFIAGRMRFAEIKDIAKFNRFASLYGYFRVTQMRIIVNAQGHVPIMFTCFDADDDYHPTAQTMISANLNSRYHQLLDGKVASRTQKLTGMSKYAEYLPCGGAQHQVQQEKYKSALMYGFSGLTGSHYNITITEEFVVNFRHMRDKIDTDEVNPTAMANLAAVGPGDTPMYYEAPDTDMVNP
jgi:hypothetical protein